MLISIYKEIYVWKKQDRQITGNFMWELYWCSHNFTSGILASYCLWGVSRIIFVLEMKEGKDRPQWKDWGDATSGQIFPSFCALHFLDAVIFVLKTLVELKRHALQWPLWQWYWPTFVPQKVITEWFKNNASVSVYSISGV